MKKINKIWIFSLLIIFSISVVGIRNVKEQENNSTLATSSSNFENKTIGWGIRRADNNRQPDVGTANKQLLDENGGICLGNDLDKVIYLTFDEGYEAGYTSKILEVLKQNDVKATFFITAHYLNTQEGLVKQMIEEGHCVGNHISVKPMYLKEKRYES